MKGRKGYIGWQNRKGTCNLKVGVSCSPKTEMQASGAGLKFDTLPELGTWEIIVCF